MTRRIFRGRLPIPFPGLNGIRNGLPDFVDLPLPFDPVCTPFSVDIGAYDAPAVVDAGTDAFCFTDDFTAATNVRITNFSSDDVINVTNNGGYGYVFGVSQLDPNDLVIARTFGTEVSFFLIDEVIPDGAGAIFDYASAVAQIGYEFLTYDDVTPVPPGGCFEQSLDIDTTGTELTVNAAFAPFCFTDDATVVTDVEIFGFSADDVIAVTNASAQDYNFSTGTTAQDLWITFNDSPNFTSIMLKGVLTGDEEPFSDYDSAVIAVGYRFMTFDCIDQSIDVGTAGTPVLFDAGLDGYCFIDDATVETNVQISGFGADDMIEVTNATASDYNFGTGSDPDDLRITFSDGAIVNDILLIGVLAASDDPVFDYETAVGAVGYDFMTFG